MGRFLLPGAENEPAIKALKDKVVIVAYEPATLQDSHPTPYSLSLWPWQGNDMSGPEIHANIIETLLTGKFPRPLPGSLSSLYLLGILLAASALFYWLSPWRGLVAGLALCTLAALSAYPHFATHGRFDPDQPLHSGLMLAKDAKNNGVLSLGELYSLRLHADLVTLSACDTGLGKIRNGDDVVGLSRGFLYAGSNTIVASLWEVDDQATSYLME